MVDSSKAKTILVSGASSGIGRETAILLSNSGYNCIIVGRDAKRLKETFYMLKGENHRLLLFDFNKLNDLEKLIFELPILDGIFHCAGVIKLKPFQFVNQHEFLDIFNTNFFAPFFLTQNLYKKKKIANHASIVFMSSISGNVIGSKGNIMYSATKSAMNGIVKTLALELSNQRIRVNAISAGMVKTEMWANEKTITDDYLKIDELKYPFGYGRPNDISELALFLLSDRSKWITGSSIIIDGGFTIQ